MKIGVFCSANQQIDPEFFTLTEELGKWAAGNGHTIVYGGVNQGLMECIAKSTKEAGGHTIGIVPMIVETSGLCNRFPRRGGRAWLNAHDSKSCIPQGIGGSNPSLSAM